MTDPTDPRSKAEASHRLAELAKTPRARELFRQLAEEYEGRARGEFRLESIEQTESAPSIVPEVSPVSSSVVRDVPIAPLSESEQWLANLAAVRAKS